MCKWRWEGLREVEARAAASWAGDPLSDEVKLTSLYFTAGATQTWAGYHFFYLCSICPLSLFLGLFLIVSTLKETGVNCRMDLLV